MPANLESVEQAIKDKKEISRKREPLRHTDTGVGTAFNVFAPGAPFKVLEFRFHLGSALAAAETLTLTRTSLLPTLSPMLTYINHVILTQDLGTTSILDLVRTFDSDEGFFTGNDSIVPALSANTGADRWGLEILYELV